ncbi:hypothetical protein [Desulfoscipio gibsoniae]|uniref:Uncharacterized protein n=1 Tax=Desulfoscipio gibsoniae DSM 7213 TaxID=767817 RepID=R4KEU0_9FIRM|nr:hypothetical protein [Desulfoscipio gibsoniae]AGL01713.1 hypothetical protein Desgi_2291 [Desulfoscipio gibsoniae DSM 7213]
MKPKEWILYAMCVFLVFIRVDIWNWGKIKEPVFLGWLSIYELYQLMIWVIGTLLLFWVNKSFWYDPDED